MGSKPFKILEDSDGKKYIFNDEAFDTAIKNKVRITEVFAKLSPYLNDEEMIWLSEKCRAIG